MEGSEMEKRALSDEEAEAVLRGEVPAGRDDLAELAMAMQEVRDAVPSQAPVPSAALLECLSADRPAVHDDLSARRTRPRAVAWIAGLGLGAQAALGATGAAAVGAGAGLTGVLPTEAKHVVEGILGLGPAGEVAETSEGEPGAPGDGPTTDATDAGSPSDVASGGEPALGTESEPFDGWNLQEPAETPRDDQGAVAPGTTDGAPLPVDPPDTDSGETPGDEPTPSESPTDPSESPSDPSGSPSDPSGSPSDPSGSPSDPSETPTPSDGATSGPSNSGSGGPSGTPTGQESIPASPTTSGGQGSPSGTMSAVDGSIGEGGGKYAEGDGGTTTQPGHGAAGRGLDPGVTARLGRVGGSAPGSGPTGN
jgi:hypothetical protein